MTLAILLVVVVILLLQLWNTWVIHDIRWGQNCTEETLDLVDFDVRDVHQAVGAKRPPHREQMWRKPVSFPGRWPDDTSWETEDLGNGRSISRGFGSCATCDGGGCGDCT